MREISLMLILLTFEYLMKIFPIIILMVVTIFCSCQNSENILSEDNEFGSCVELTAEEAVSISFNDTTSLSEKEIIKILNDYINGLSISSPENKTLNIKHINKKFITNPNSILYEVEYELEGNNKAIISGDKRFPYILAIFQLDSQESKDLIDVPPFTYAQDILSNHIYQIEHLKDSLYQSTVAKIEQNLGLNFESLNNQEISRYIKIKDNSLSRATIVTNPPDDAIAGNGPFISVSWNQGMPYNQLMPQSCPDNWLWDNRYPISSVVVATAQIFSFLRPSMKVYGNSIDWDYLCEKEEIHDTYDYFGSYTKDPDDKCLMVAQLMKYIGEQCEVSYSCNSSTVYPQKVIDFFKSYNIKIDNGQNLDVSKLKASIDELRPVLMYGQDSNGGGHWWVVDGYRTQPATRGTFFPGYNVYMHANMGKGKSYTGYYLVGSDGTLTFNTTFAHFNKNFKMYGNIYNL